MRSNTTMSLKSEIREIKINGNPEEIVCHTAVPSDGGEYHSDKSDTVVFCQGIGEVGPSQKKIVQFLADLLRCRVFGYEGRLPELSKDPYEDAIRIATETHLRVTEGLTSDGYSIVGHSMAGITTGALVEKQEDQISALTLISPGGIALSSDVSDTWIKAMASMTLEERAQQAREQEPNHRINSYKQLFRFAIVNGLIELVHGVATDPAGLTRATMGLRKDMKPGLKIAPDALGLNANVTCVPELVAAQERGTAVNILYGARDHVFTAANAERALKDTILEPKLHIIGGGHSNLSTRAGNKQLVAATKVHGK